MYEPGNWMARGFLTPLLLVISRDDKLTVTDLALQAFEQALEPKQRIYHMNCLLMKHRHFFDDRTVG